MKKIKRDTRKMKLMVILGIIILPLVYSLFYLKGFWDPYNSLDNVPVALVNLDECSENCKGDKLIDTLKEKDVFDFDIVNEKKADEGLINKDYYAVIKIPKNFTSNLESAADTDRKQATITYAPNTKTSYLASQIIGTAVSEIENELTSEVNKELVSTLADNLQSVPNQTKQVSDALGIISNGTNRVNNGVFELKDGINKLSTNYKEFNNGVEKLSNGAITLNSSYEKFNEGIERVYSGADTLKQATNGLDVLVNSVGTLKAGSDNYTTGLSSYQSKSNDMIDKTELVYQLIINYYENNTGVQVDTNWTNAYYIAKGYMDSTSGSTGLDQLKDGLSELVKSNVMINSGINQMAGSASNLANLKGGIDALEAGLFELKNNSNKVYNGISEINSGLSTLNINSKLITTGLSRADDGATILANGTTTLDNGVNTAKDTIDDKVEEVSKQTSSLVGLDEYAKDPVKVNEEDRYKVDNYGTFFSPYFMSLSLWIGGILILMGLYYDPDHRFKTLGRNSANRGKRLVLYNIIGVIQAILLAFILQISLGFTVTNIFVYYGSCILISEAFLAIIMFLFFNFQDIGKFLALVFLVMQLAACGGTFPVQTEPLIYQIIYPFMPMTYSVDLLRESFVSINSSFLIKDIVVLLIILVVFNGLTFITSMLKAKKEKRAI